MINQQQNNQNINSISTENIASNYKPYLYTIIVAIIAVAGLGYYLMPTQKPYEVEDTTDAATTIRPNNTNNSISASNANNQFNSEKSFVKNCSYNKSVLKTYWSTHIDMSNCFSIQFPGEYMIRYGSAGEGGFYIVSFDNLLETSTQNIFTLRIYTLTDDIKNNLQTIETKNINGLVFYKGTFIRGSEKPGFNLSLIKDDKYYEFTTTDSKIMPTFDSTQKFISVPAYQIMEEMLGTLTFN